MTTNRGHALCVGISGSGKTAIIKLAAYAAGCEVFEFTSSQGCNISELREKVKGLYLQLVKENRRMVLIVSDENIADEGRIIIKYVQKFFRFPGSGQSNACW